MKIEYEVSELLPYVNWLYFYHAWGLGGKPDGEKAKMRGEALSMLQDWEGKCRARALFRLMEAYGDGDDLLLYADGGRGESLRLPLLRQQHPSAPGQPNLCLADYVRPLSQGVRDHVGLFSATVDGAVLEPYRHDEYLAMLAQTLADRLAEATAEKLHQQVRTRLWGYAPHEDIAPDQLHREEYQGIRPAIGYPSLPDTSVNFILDQLLGMGQVGIRLTESGMMTPHASVSGLMFAHPKARYFSLGKIGEDQLRDYARRRALPVELMRKFLQASLLR